MTDDKSSTLRILPATPEPETLQGELDLLLEALRNNLQALKLLQGNYELDQVGTLDLDIADAVVRLETCLGELACRWSIRESLWGKSDIRYCERAGAFQLDNERYCLEHVALLKGPGEEAP